MVSSLARMRLSPFRLERYFARHEFSAPYMLSGSDCEPFRIGELLALEDGAAQRLESCSLGYTETAGHPRLRSSIARLYETVDVDEIVVHSGGEEGILTVVTASVGPGDHAVVHYPSYQSLHEVTRATGCDVTLWTSRAEDDWRLDLDFLRDNLRPNTRLIVINCPHNPTGYQMARGEFQEIIDLARHAGVTILSDEVYRGLEYDIGDSLPAVCDVYEHGVSLGVMSKTYGLAGLRIGWIATSDRTLLHAVQRLKDYTTICNSAPSEFLATVALGARQAILARNRTIVRSNLGILQAFLAEHADRIHCVEPKAGVVAFPEMRHVDDVEHFCRDALAQAGVLLLPGTVFQPDSTRFRVGFGRRGFADALDRFDQFLRGRF